MHGELFGAERLADCGAGVVDRTKTDLGVGALLGDGHHVGIKPDPQ